MIETLAVHGYRSLRDLVAPMGPLTVVTGENGTGKSSLYRSLRLLAASATGDLVRSVAREGGLPSMLWAGPERITQGMRDGTMPIRGGRRRTPKRVKLGFAADDLSYAVELGLPAVGMSAFERDPEIKRETVWVGDQPRPSSRLAERNGPTVRVRDAAHAWSDIDVVLASYESMLSELADPVRAPEVLFLRRRLRSWRFYDHFRTDADAPARRPQIGTRTPALAHDGADVAAALQTIREIGDVDAMNDAVADAFHGASVHVQVTDGQFRLEMEQPGLLRPLDASELSDGTLRFLMWVAALLTPRPPELMVVNEPETSLHVDLVPALARLLARASEQTQVWVVSHDRRLVAALEEAGAARVELVKDTGETQVSGQDLLSTPRWSWP